MGEEFQVNIYLRILWSFTQVALQKHVMIFKSGESSSPSSISWIICRYPKGRLFGGTRDESDASQVQQELCANLSVYLQVSPCKLKAFCKAVVMQSLLERHSVMDTVNFLPIHKMIIALGLNNFKKMVQRIQQKLQLSWREFNVMIFRPT